MLSIRILVLISVPLLFECQSSALFCTHEGNDFEVNRLQSVFTVKNKVYITVGSSTTKLWVYDIDRQQVLEKQIIGEQMFPGLPIVEFVSVVLCDQCPEEVSNLAIVIGRRDLKSHHKFVTYRLQSDDKFVKIDGKDLPKNWGLRDGEEEISSGSPFYGFFPENLATPQTNWSLIDGFTFLPWLQTFHLKYNLDINTKYMLYRKVKTNGDLTDWKDMNIGGDPVVLNSAFYIRDKIYTIDNDPQYMPRISHQIIPSSREDGDLRFEMKIIDVDARQFFNCLDKTTPTLTTPPVPSVTSLTTTPTKTTTTSTTTTEATSVMTAETTPTVTEGSTTLFTSSGPQVSTKLTTSEITDTTARESSESTEAGTPQKIDDKEKDNFTLFWLIFFVLFLAILIVVFCLIIVCIYMRRPNKGDQYDSIRGNSSTSSINKSTVFFASPSSSITMKSRNDNPNNEGKGTDNQSPSTASMRSYSKKPVKSEIKEGSPQSSTSPSTSSVKSLKT